MFILTSTNCIQKISDVDVQRKGICSEQQQFSLLKNPEWDSVLNEGVKVLVPNTSVYVWILCLSFHYRQWTSNRYMQCISERVSFNNNYNLAAHVQAFSAIWGTVGYQAISLWLAVSSMGDVVLLNWEPGAKMTLSAYV